ncbi:hypothetical protein LR48_Vigan03g200000 [Vigna angularis]|uniref:Uncharacterized protein n=1 Tax=Phaseolus angularis TaxID=3914 RepID=A0A0L9U734_PHAAN|nr:hypothetical protein LR48_Vigan03g200000 [Vigna angularis]
MVPSAVVAQPPRPLFISSFLVGASTDHHSCHHSTSTMSPRNRTMTIFLARSVVALLINSCRHAQQPHRHHDSHSSPSTPSRVLHRPNNRDPTCIRNTTRENHPNLKPSLHNNHLHRPSPSKRHPNSHRVAVITDKNQEGLSIRQVAM